MSQSKRGWVLSASAVMLAVTRMTSAQTARGGHAETAAAQQPQLPLGVIMQNNGGSLLRAEIASRPAVDPLIFNTGAGAAGSDAAATGAAPGTAASISFFAVAPEQPKTLKKHDLVTIVVHEEGASATNGSTDLKKQEDFDAQLDAFVAFRLSHPQIHGIIPGGAEGVPEVKAQGSRDYKGSGDVSRSDSLTERITAEIVDVKPNGTIVLQAQKRIKTDEEEQKMILTGICRASDVSGDNTILSTQLFNLQLEKTHTGAVDDANKRGLVPRLLDQINPF